MSSVPFCPKPACHCNTQRMWNEVNFFKKHTSSSFIYSIFNNKEQKLHPNVFILPAGQPPQACLLLSSSFTSCMYWSRTEMKFWKCRLKPLQLFMCKKILWNICLNNIYVLQKNIAMMTMCRATEAVSAICIAGYQQPSSRFYAITLTVYTKKVVS